MHITSLPGPEGMGTLGWESFQWIDFLHAAGQKLWQVLPVNPAGFGNSPYSAFSSCAGNPLMISVEQLAQDGLLSSYVPFNAAADITQVSYQDCIAWKMPLLAQSSREFFAGAVCALKNEFEKFKKDNAGWLDDYSLFMAVKDHFGGKWWVNWNKDIKYRKPEALARYRELCAAEINDHMYMQFVFFRQWNDMKKYANQNGISLVGDIPMFVAADSADVWAHPDYFALDEKMMPAHVAGVPPDYFNRDGQIWGNPVYNWNSLRRDNYAWWIKRIEMNYRLMDIVRIDHFRGFEATWAIPAHAEKSVEGRWVDVPGRELFSVLHSRLGQLNVIAEDLGINLERTHEMRDHFGYMGMKIMIFAFNRENNLHEFLPHNCLPTFALYTGTHDSEPVKSWFANAPYYDREYILQYLDSTEENLHWDMVRSAWSSNAAIAIAPFQDVLGTGTLSRMNTPGKSGGNWQWRCRREDLSAELADRLKYITTLYQR